MLKDIIVEMERAAKAFDLSDIDTAALCCRKAVEGHIKMRPPQPSAEPSATDTHSEFNKAVVALETKNFTLAALCLEKAAASMVNDIPYEMLIHFERMVNSLRAESFTSVADAIREGIHTAVGIKTVEPVKTTI